MKQYAIFDNDSQTVLGYIMTDAPRNVFEMMTKAFCTAQQTGSKLSMAAIVDALRSCGHRAMTEDDIRSCFS